MKKIEEHGRVSFVTAIKDYFKGFIEFNGRSTRAGYWWAFLAYCLFAITCMVLLLCIIGATLYTTLGNLQDSSIYLLMDEDMLSQYMMKQLFSIGVGVFITTMIIIIMILAVRFGFIALTVRRLRDLGCTTIGIMTWIAILLLGFVGCWFVYNTFIFCLSLLIGVINIVLMALPTDSLQIASSSSWMSHFFVVKEATTSNSTAAYEAVPTTEEHLTSKNRPLSDVDRASLSIQEKHIHHEE